MKRSKQFISTLIFSVLFLSLNGVISAQELSAGADIVSKYMWRGLEINAVPNIQPSLSFSSSGFNVGFWGSYSFSADTAGVTYEEIDTYLGYTFTTESGDFGLLLTDYYFPKAGFKLGNFDSDGMGAHTLELAASYSGPVSVLVAYNIYNDPGNNVYFELGYDTSIGDTEFKFFVGGTTGSKDNPVYYGSDNFAIINVGVTGSKTIKVTDSFELPVFTTFLFNPKVDSGYLVFGFSF